MNLVCVRNKLSGSAILSIVTISMGSATGGARGAMAPPKNGLGGPVMHLAPPPIFWENSVMKHN